MEHPDRRALALVALVLTGAVVAASAAWATLTAPSLRLDAVEVEALEEGGAWLRVTGEFPYDAAALPDYPLQLFVRQTEGERFVCFSTWSGVMEGSDKLARKGLSQKEALELADVVRPSPSARIIEFAPGRIEVMLPDDFPRGGAEAQLFVVYNGHPLFSNPIPFEIEEATE
jgi:hypothetical protein